MKNFTLRGEAGCSPEVMRSGFTAFSTALELLRRSVYPVKYPANRKTASLQKASKYYLI
jgi:hypothetical protein